MTISWSKNTALNLLHTFGGTNLSKTEARKMASFFQASAFARGINGGVDGDYQRLSSTFSKFAKTGGGPLDKQGFLNLVKSGGVNITA